MIIKRQQSAEVYKLWNEENLPKTPFVLITPAETSEEEEKEYLVIPQKYDNEGEYHLISLFNAYKSNLDSSSLVSKMNATGVISVRAVISGRMSFFADGAGNRPIFSQNFLRDSSINLIKSDIDGYCIVVNGGNSLYSENSPYDVIPLNGKSVKKEYGDTILKRVKDGIYDLMDDAELTISSVHVLPNV